jgi:hypothetical protein
MKALVLTGPNNEVHLVILPPKNLTKGEVATLQNVADIEFNQGLIEVDVENARDYNHVERIIRRMNGH